MIEVGKANRVVFFGIHARSVIPTPFAPIGAVIVSLPLKGKGTVELYRIEGMGNGYRIGTDGNARRQIIRQLRDINLDRVAVNGFFFARAGRNIGKGSVNPVGIYGSHLNTVARTADRNRIQCVPLIGAFYIVRVMLGIYFHPDGSAVVVTVVALNIIEREADHGIAFANFYGNFHQIALTLTQMLSHIILVSTQYLMNRIRNDISNGAFSGRSFNKHHIAGRIGIPTYHGTGITIISHQRINRVSKTIVIISANLHIGHPLRLGKLDENRVG